MDIQKALDELMVIQEMLEDGEEGRKMLRVERAIRLIEEARYTLMDELTGRTDVTEFFRKTRTKK